jgi:hypothetical protein
MSSRYELEVFGPRLDLAAVDRIVAAVPAPAGIDRRALLADLEGAHAIYRTGVVLRERPAEREQMVARAVAALQRGRGLLGAYIATYGTLHLRRRLAALDRVLEDIRKESSPGLNRIVGFKQSRTVSAFDNLVGGLAEIFEIHWWPEGAGYTITVDTINRKGDVIEGGQVQGNFIDFACTALIELGIYKKDGDPRAEPPIEPTPYTRKAIATAFSKVKPKP